MLPAESPSRSPVCVCVRVSKRRHSLCRLVSCNRVYIYIYTYISIRVLCLVIVSYLLCRRAAFFAPFRAGARASAFSPSLSLSLSPLLIYFSDQDPGGPALFSTHAHNNATSLVNPT